MKLPITVLVPVRNGEATLDRAVRSTLRALPADATVLVHDDASTDRTPEILGAVGDPRLEVVRSDPPRGVAGGLNHLLQRVRTPLVGRMDADDVTLPWRFRAQRWRIGVGADVVFSTVVSIGEVGRGGVRPSPPLPITPDAFPLHLLLANPVAHSTMLARTEVLTTAGGYRATPAEDYELWLRLCGAARRCARLALPTILYRFHAHQVTASTGYRSEAFAEPDFVASYTALSKQVLGTEPFWYEDLHGDEAAASDAPARLFAFAAAMKDAAAPLSPLQRDLVLRKVAAAITGVDARQQ